MSDAPRNQSSSLRRALEILAYVEQHGGGRGVSLSDLADAVALSKSTILRLTGPLHEAGLLVRDAESGRYRLGLGALRLGQAYLSTVDLRTVAGERLRALHHACRLTCHLVVPDGTHVVYVDKVEAQTTVRMGSRVGSRAPMYCTGVGKAILAWLDPGDRDAVLAGELPAVTPYTVTDPGRLRAELELVRQRGYATDEEEHELDVRCVAAPFFDHEARIAGALSVSGLASRLIPEEVAGLVAEAGRDVSRQLGCPHTTDQSFDRRRECP